jgi:ribosomal protein S8
VELLLQDIVLKRPIFKLGKTILPAYNLGILLVSTSKGIMSHHELKVKG